MEFFKSSLKSVLGTPQENSKFTGAETVDRLLDRVQSSTLLDDRRDACRGLRALSQKYRTEVGAHGMDALIKVLETDRNDCEIIGYVLDTLCNIMSSTQFEDEETPNMIQTGAANIGQQFTEIFIKHPDNVSLVAGFLEEYEFQVRWPVVKLLTAMLANRPKDIQDIILVSPMGVSKLMDLLSDSREVIRNDALLLLTELTKGNANIQKIVAFENAFDRLFDVIVEEGNADGGIVVEDCLLLMLNLLRNNTSNQNFFKEGSYIQRLAPMFEISAENKVQWPLQKAKNIRCMLQIVRTLVAPGNPAQVIASSQKKMRESGLLEALSAILMIGGMPADILAEAINTVGEVIRGNIANQEYFASLIAPTNPPRSAIVILLLSMVNEKPSFMLRCSVLYSFQCYLFKNEVGQAQLVQTLLPSSSEAVTLTSGQLLCGGLFSGDAISNWFSAVALSHGLVENPVQKELLLRVMLASNIGSPSVSLLQQCTILLQQNNRVQSKLGLLMLLSMWMSHCPLAVKQFLSISTSIPYLTAQAGSNEHDDDEELVQGLCAFLMGVTILFNDDSVPAFSKTNLKQLIEKRIGVETFLDKLGEISKHELYSRAVKHPQIMCQKPSELLLDHEFCRLFKALEGMIVKAVTPNKEGTEFVLLPSENSLLLQYKEVIREQDKQIQQLEQSVAIISHEKAQLQVQVQELGDFVNELRQENTLLRNQDNYSITESKQVISKIEDNQIIEQNGVSITNLEDHSEQLRKELENLRQAREYLLELLTEQDIKLNQYKQRLRDLGEKVDDEDEEETSLLEDTENGTT